MNSLLCEEQVLDIAQDMAIGNTRVLYSDEKDEVIVIVKERRKKVEELKSDSKLGVSPFYLEDINVLQVSISPFMGIADKDSFISANISLDQETCYNSLKRAAENNQGIEFYTVSDDLEVISVRRILNNPMGSSQLLRQLERHEK